MSILLKLQCDIVSDIIPMYCLDAYGCQMWNFDATRDGVCCMAERV